MPERKIASTSSRLGTGRGGIEFWNSGILGEFKNSRIQESGILGSRDPGILEMAKIKAPKIWHTGQCVPSLGARAIVSYVSVHGHRVLTIGARANDS